MTLDNATLAWLPSVSQHFLLGALALLTYILTTRVRRETRAPATAIAWVLGLVLLPYLVLPMYLMFGSRKLRPAGRQHHRQRGMAPHWAAELVESFGLPPPSRCTVRLHDNGDEARTALWDTIARAQRTLDVGTFIIGRDRIGNETLDRLVACAERGVRVRVLLDGFGALSLPQRHFARLRAAGGKVAVFRPLLSLRGGGPRNLRNHRKVTIADRSWLWSGGRNLADEYFGGRQGERAWDDLSFDLEGGVAAAAAHQFEQDWAAAHPSPPGRTPAPTDVPQGAPAQFMPSGPDQTEDTAHALLIGACFRAENRILAVTPYFVPDEGLRDALRLAARRGVHVTIAIPLRSNHRMADFVRTRAMRDLARAGVEFRMLPHMAHAKAVVVDDSLALCGSINLDLRSLLLNHEAAVVFYGRASIDWLVQWIETTASAGEPYRARRPGLLRDLAEGLLLTVAFQL